MPTPADMQLLLELLSLRTSAWRPGYHHKRDNGRRRALGA